MSRAGLDPHQSFPTQDILGYRPIPYTTTIVAKAGILLPGRFNITTLFQIQLQRCQWKELHGTLEHTALQTKNILAILYLELEL